LRRGAAAEVEPGCFVELREGTRHAQLRPSFRLRAFQVEPGGFTACRGSGELIVRGDGVGPGLFQVFGSGGQGDDDDGGNGETTVGWFHRLSLGG
jgi:hypothetical protein